MQTGADWHRWNLFLTALTPGSERGERRSMHAAPCTPLRVGVSREVEQECERGSVWVDE